MIARRVVREKGCGVPHCTAFHINGFQIVIDEQQRQLTINGRRLHLGTQEYRVARDLVVQFAAYKVRQMDDPLVSLDALGRVAEVPLHRVKHIVSEVRGLLLPHDLDIKSVRGEGYYLSPVRNVS
jgi:DNA-binding response OmpR family regulator